MTTTSALSTALSGLRVSQKALDVTAANIANATTEGYTKKTLNQEAFIADGVGIGVRFSEVSRNVDKAVQRDYREQLGVTSYYTVKESYLSRIIALSGATDAESNIGSQLGNLYNSIVSLSALPDSTATQNSVLAAAGKLAQVFNKFSNEVNQIRNDTQKDLKAEVATLNSALENIATLNKSISGMAAIGRSTAELEDQRDLAVKSVAQQIDISYYTNGNGVLVLQTKNGHVLVDTEARPVTFADATINQTTLYPDSDRVGGIMLQDTKSGEPYDLASSSTGGRIGALLNLRDNEIPSYNAQLDELAHKLMLRFDDQGVRLFVDGAGTVPVNNPSAYAGIAATIKVNQAIIDNPALLQQGTSGPPIASGSSAVVDKMLNYTFGKFKDAAGTLNTEFNMSGAGYNQKISYNITGDANATLSAFANAFIDGQSQSYDQTKSALKTETAYGASLETRLLDGSAVNTDQEMTKMIEFQRTYSASAKMISALDELFRDLLNAI